VPSAEATPLVSIVVVTVAEYTLTAACLRSLREQDYPRTETILVCNGSPDDVVQRLRREFPECSIGVIPRNRGFAGGYNEGLRKATGAYVAIINDDAIAEPSWIREMLAVARATDGVGIVGCSVVQADAPTVLDSQGLGIGLDGMSRQVNRGVGLDRAPSLPGLILPSGCACMFSHDALRDVGLFDETFFAYCEDTDLGLRMLWAGYGLVVAPRAVVRHHYSMTSGKHSWRKVFWVERNHFRVALKSFPIALLLGVPIFTLQRYTLQARALWRQEGELPEYTRSAGLAPFIGSMAAAYVSFLGGVPRLLAERRRVMRSRRVSTWKMTRLIARSRMSLDEIVAGRSASQPANAAPRRTQVDEVP